jgi:hypothetical protein
MQQKLCKLVLILMLLMAVASPFMQLDSWDKFPAATGDIELQMIMNLCVLGMFFVFARILFELFPAFLNFSVLVQSAVSRLSEAEPVVCDSCRFGFSPPLRN